MLRWLILAVGSVLVTEDDQWVNVSADDEECLYILKKAVEQWNSKTGKQLQLVGVKHIEKRLFDLDLFVRATVILVDLDIAEDYDVEVVRYPIEGEVGILSWEVHQYRVVKVSK